MDPKPNEAHVLVRQKGAMAERHLPHLRQPNQEGHGVSFRLKRRRGQAAAIRRVSSDLAPGDGASQRTTTGARSRRGWPAESVSRCRRAGDAAADHPDTCSDSVRRISPGSTSSLSCADWGEDAARDPDGDPRSTLGCACRAQSASGDLCLASASLHQSGSMALLYSCNSRAGASPASARRHQSSTASATWLVVTASDARR
jgi:hypothetical protein